MANIRLSRIEAEECDLPRVCARCGAAASSIAYKEFSWHPDWIYFFLVLGCLLIVVFPLFLLGIVVYLVFNWKLSKRMQVRLPFCRDHANHWQLRSLLTGASLVLVVPIEFAMLMLQIFQQDRLGSMVLPTACCLVPTAWLILALVLDLTSIRCLQITDQAIQLSGVHQDFVAAVAAEHQRHLELLSNQPADSLSDSSIRSAEPPRRPPPVDGDEFFAPRKD